MSSIQIGDKSMLSVGRERVLLVAFFAMIVLVLMSPLSGNAQVPNVATYLNHIALIVQAKMALVEGQFPLRVTPLEFDSWRYPGFQFYSPTSYLVAGWIYKWITPLNPFEAYKLTIGGALTLGGVCFYYLAYAFFRNKPLAVLAAIVYLAAPYDLLVVNHLGGFNEALSFGILPLVLYCSFRSFYTPSCFFWGATALSWYVLATVHVLSFFYTSAFMVVLFLSGMLVRCSWHVKGLLSLVSAYLFSCLLAAWYLVPALMWGLYGLVSNKGQVDFLASGRLSLSNLLAPTASMLPSELDVSHAVSMMHPSLGLPVIAAVGVLMYALLSKQLSGSKLFLSWLLPVSLVFLILFFELWSPMPRWQLSSGYLGVMQHSWVLFNLLAVVGALFFAWALAWVCLEKIDIRHVVLGVLVIIISVSAWLPVYENTYVPIAATVANPVSIPPFQNDDLMNKHAVEEQVSNRFGSGKSLKLLAYDKKDLVVTKASCAQRKDSTICLVQASSLKGRVVLPVLYYPNLLEVRVNGQAVDYAGVLDGDRYRVSVQPLLVGANKVSVRFRGLVWANQVSWCAWILWLVLCLGVVLRRIFFKK